MLAEVGATERVGLDSDSGIKHLAQSLFLSGWKESRLMALAAYFDASGHEDDQRFLVVAGFVSDGSGWADFDKLWSERLRDDGIAYFHAAEFAHSTDQFAIGWKDNEVRRRMLGNDLMDILKRHVFRKFGCAIINDTLSENMSEEVKTENYVNAYSLAGRTCVTYLWQWLRQNQWKTVPALIFEDGDKGQDRLRKGMEQDEFPQPVFKPKKDRIRKDGLIEKGVVPLQAADWLAYESFLAMKKENLDRWARQEFESTPGEIGVYLPSGIQEIQDLLSYGRGIKKAVFTKLP
jgi:hypothetical protein